METVRSRDGTCIAFDRIGQGTPVVLVVGAFNVRATGQPLAEALASDHTVFTYDRRGRGDSTDTPPYAVAREIDDLAAVIEAAGSSAAVFGYSSGAMLGLQAAAAGLSISRLAMYEAPYLPRGAAPDISHTDALAELIDAGRRGEAVEYFQTRVVGIPAATVVQMRTAPFRPALEAMAHTLVYEAMVLGDRALPTDLAGQFSTPTLVMAGGASSAFMSTSAQSLASILSNAQLLILDGQNHDLNPSVLAPALRRFLQPSKDWGQPSMG